MQKKEIIEGLVKIGLNEKEARVYLAALELGEATAQQIAAKATVNRPSTYIAIESLSQRGMMSSFQKGKKRYFLAGKPRQLAYIIDQAKRVIHEQESAINGLIESLDSYIDSEEGESRLEVRILEGFDGIRALQTDALDSDATDVYEILALDEVRKVIPADAPDDLRNQVRKKFYGHSHTIYTSASGPILNLKKGGERIYLDNPDFPLFGDISIFGDRVSFASYANNQIKGVTVQNKDFANTMRTLFRALKKASDNE